jgi:hypothetical protein
MSFIDLTSVELEKSIYRFSDFSRIVRIFQTNEMILVRPEKWDDPFENYIINAKFKYSDGDTLDLSLRSTLHGSCWTKKSVSDAMWRIYSPDKISVRIKSTPKLLGEALNSALKNYARSKWFVGKVKYYPQSKILSKAKFLANQILSDASEEAAAKSLLFKRNAFSHEQEVRILVIDRHQKAKNGMIKIKLDPHKVIQGILVDSRAPDEWLQVYSTYLKNQLGFKGRVTKSTLYNPVDPVIIRK